jgi:hypothetical protein
MKKVNAIIYGTGDESYYAYQKLKDLYKEICFIDDGQTQVKTEIFGRDIIDPDQFSQQVAKNVDIFVCTIDYFKTTEILIEKGISDYYVIMDGFIWHSDTSETMMPFELYNYQQYNKNGSEKNILFINKHETERMINITKESIKRGFKVFFLSTIIPQDNINLFEKIFIFSTPNAIVDFISNSEFDEVWSFDTSSVLTSIAMCSSKEIKLDKDSLGAIDGRAGIISLALDYMTRAYCEPI